MDGWSEDISKCQSKSELPHAVQQYIDFIKKEVKVPISWVETGPEREAIFLNE